MTGGAPVAHIGPLVLDPAMGRISPAVVSFQGSVPDGQPPVEAQIWVSRARVAKPGLKWVIYP